jgi:hypothetical protein
LLKKRLKPLINQGFNGDKYLLVGRAPSPWKKPEAQGRAFATIFLPEKGKKDFRSIPHAANWNCRGLRNACGW